MTVYLKENKAGEVVEIHLVAQNNIERKQLEKIKVGKSFIPQQIITAIEQDPERGEVERKVVRLIR